MMFREYGIDFSPGGPGAERGRQSPNPHPGAKGGLPGRRVHPLPCPGWIRSRQGLPPDPGPKRSRGASGAGPGTSPAETRAGTGPRPRPAGRSRAAHARPRPAHVPGVRRICSTGPASRRCRGPRSGWRRVARPRKPWGVRSGRGTTGAVPAGGASGSPRAVSAGRPCRPGRTVPAVEAIRHGADGLLADMRTQVRGPGVYIPLHRIEPLAQLPVRQPLAVGAGLGEPGVPERVPRPVAGHARKPPVRQALLCLPVRRAGYRPRPHRVHDAQHGAAGGQSAPPAGPGVPGTAARRRTRRMPWWGRT